MVAEPMGDAIQTRIPMALEPLSALAPGSRVIVRDEEWLVRRVDRTESGAQLLTVTGLSHLGLNREAYAQLSGLPLKSSTT